MSTLTTAPAAPAPDPARRPLPGIAAAIAAVILIGLSLAYLMITETPTGRITGRVYMTDSKLPLADADIYLTPAVHEDKDPDMTENAARPRAEEDIREHRHAHTDAEGRFTLTRVPVGQYTILAVSHAHRSDEANVAVAESYISTLELPMKRSEADLEVATHQDVFATSEKPILPLRGYVDAKALKKGANGKTSRDTLHIQVYRTRFTPLLKNTASAASLLSLQNEASGNKGRLDRDLLHPSGGTPAPQLVQDRSVPITSADREGFFHERVPLGVQGAGLYLIQVEHAGVAARSSVIVTDIALVAKRSAHQTAAYAANILTGVPLSGVTVRYYKYNQMIGSATTGADGTAIIDRETGSNADADAANPMLIATSGRDETVIRGSYYAYEEHGSYVVHAYTDRTVYRPGDTISYKAIARRKRALGAGYDVPRGVPVQVEIRSPNGERILREAKVTDSHGTFHGTIDLSSEAPSGSYSIETHIGDETHTSDVTVASYKKPEFAVTVTPTQPRYVRGDTVEMTIEGKYYFGGPVAGAKVHYSVFRAADWSAEYAGDDDSDDSESEEYGEGGRGYYGSTVVQGDVTLGADGKALVRFPANPLARDVYSDSRSDDSDQAPAPEDIPQEQTYTLTASVTDESKREVSADGAVHVSAGDFALTATPEGYLAAPNQASGIVVRAQDHDGKPVGGVTIEVTPSFHKEKSSNHSDSDEDSDKDDTETLPSIHATTDTNGTALVKVTPPHAGDMRLVVRATDSKGRAIYTNNYLWVSGDEGGDLNTDYSDLSLHTDKRRYQPGETARVLVNTARTGESVLLTVEGDRVYAHYTVPISKPSTVVRVPVLESYGPNVTLAACYVRDKKFASSQTPLRVSLITKTLNVTVTADRGKYQPGESASYDVKITDQKGSPVAGCPFSLGVVDESIYALRPDDPKAMRQEFYPQRYNRVSTDYSFAVRYLGDADKSEPKITARRKFHDTAFWEPDLETDGSGHAHIKVTFPDNLTTWRASVYACSDETALGYGISKVIVTKPFFVRLETPRFLTQGDRSRFMTIVHNDTGADQSVQVRLKIAGVTLDGNSDTQTLSVKAGQDVTTLWPLTAKEAGDAPIRLTAWTGGSPQFTDGIEKSLPVKPRGREQFTTVSGVLREASPSDTQTLQVDAAAVPSANRLVVRVTPSIGAGLTGGLDYLVGYPYGCTEQTLSRFVPDLLVQRLQKRLGRTVLTGSVKDADLSKMVRDGVTRLRNFQHDSGGWGWWEHDPDDPFMTAYVLYGLSIAKAEGYEIDDTMLEKGRKAGAKLLKSAPMADKPFLMYALTLAGDLATPRQAAAGLELKKIAPDGLAYLVLMERAMGIDPRSSVFYNELQRRAHPQGSLYYWKNPELRWNGSDRMATALGLEAILTVDPADSRIPQLLRWLMQSRTEGYFASTRDTAWVLTAFCDYLTLHPEDAAAPSGTLTIRVNGQPVQNLDTAAAAADASAANAQNRDAEQVLRIPASALRSGANTLTVESSGTSTIFYTASLTQTVVAPENASLEALPAPPQYAGLSITREYLRVLPRPTGDNSFALTTEDAGGKFEQGDNVRVRLTITTPKDLEYVLIKDPFPSDFEPTERGTADEDEEDSGWGWWYSDVDIRDDHLALFVRNLSKGKHVYEYNLRAQTPGTCRALPTQLQAMYAEDVHVETGDAKLEVQGE